MIQTKRAYDPKVAQDGARFLVDRLWPRGVKKETLGLTAWLKDVAPSDDLRRWFGHDPAKWDEFRRRYREELRDERHAAALAELVVLARQGPLTLVYGARDTEHNAALVVRDVLVERLT